MMKSILIVGLLASTLACGQAEARDQLGAVLGGVAVGAVGGVILGSALSNANAQPVPVYAARPRTVSVEEVDAPPPRRVVIDHDPFDDQAFRLHDRCDDGDRHACIRFGIMIGQHRERVATWRRSHPDFFAYED